MPYIVQTATAHMPTSCKGRYRRIAVLEVDAGVSRVAMISDRARGVRRVVATWEKLNVGHTKRCAFERALTEARELITSLEDDEIGPSRCTTHGDCLAYPLLGAECWVRNHSKGEP